MHSSRMRTGRSLTVCWRLLPGGCLPGPGGYLPGPGGGVCLVQGVGLPGLGGSGPGGVASQHALRQTPPPWTESQTPV